MFTVNVLAVPSPKAGFAALVIEGANVEATTVKVKDCVVSGETPLLAVIVNV